MWCRRLKHEPHTASTVSFLGSTSVKRNRIVSRHDLAEEASDTYAWLRTCKKFSCWFRRICSRQQRLNCAQFGSSQVILTVRLFYVPQYAFMLCAQQWRIIHYITCMQRLFLAGVRWRGSTALSPFQFGEVNVIVFVTQDSCWKIKDRWTEWL